MRRFLIGVVMLGAAGGASACPMCKDSVPNQEGARSLRDSYNSNGENISGGINASVYFMLGGLVGVIVLVGTVVVRGVRGADGGRGFAVEPKDKGEGT